MSFNSVRPCYCYAFLSVLNLCLGSLLVEVVGGLRRFFVVGSCDLLVAPFNVEIVPLYLPPLFATSVRRGDVKRRSEALRVFPSLTLGPCVSVRSASSKRAIYEWGP